MHLPVSAAPAPSRDMAEHLRRLEHEETIRLTAVAGRDSLCTLSRAGEPRPAAKYHEGAAAALAQARRAVDRLASGSDTSAAVQAVRDRFRALGEARTTPAWQAYVDGALDALDAAEQEGDDTRHPPHALDPAPEPAASTTEVEPAGSTAVPAQRAERRWSRRRSIATAALALPVSPCSWRADAAGPRAGSGQPGIPRRASRLHTP